jgi:hypothetical protein
MFCSALLQRKGTHCHLLSHRWGGAAVWARSQESCTNASLSPLFRPRLHIPLPFLHISNPGCLREDLLSDISFPQSFLCFILLTSLVSCTRLLSILTSLLSSLLSTILEAGEWPKTRFGLADALSPFCDNAQLLDRQNKYRLLTQEILQLVNYLVNTQLLNW